MDISHYITYDLPVPYRNILIYPITVKDYSMFSALASCLTIDKNSIPNPVIIRMSDLEYIYKNDRVSDDKAPYLLFLDRLLSLCLKDDKSFEKLEESINRYNLDEKGKPFFVIDGEIFKNKDFLEMRNIIAQQNDVELIDENISKEVRDSIEKAREYKRKLNGEKTASLEDYIVSLSVATGWSLEYVYNLTIRKFLKSIRRMDTLVHYKIFLQASMSGMVEFKDKSFIKHWLSNIDDTDKYKDVSVGLDALQSKISLESAKK